MQGWLKMQKRGLESSSLHTEVTVHGTLLELSYVFQRPDVALPCFCLFFLQTQKYYYTPVYQCCTSSWCALLSIICLPFCTCGLVILITSIENFLFLLPQI